MRDEFTCPITYELLREPVVAQDGHTYEKSAIEKWFRSKDTSPLNGGPVLSKEVLPNHALKKLIQDLINEGAQGLYTADSLTRDRKVDIYKERVLILKCVGPPEAKEWYLESFQVTPRGCIGGRRQSTKDTLLSTNRDVIKFSDATVSRRHFEIAATAPGQYSIRDLGSAGGTFFRIPFRTSKELHPYMIVMLGKHQFIVTSIDSCDTGAVGGRLDEPPSTERSIAMLVREAEDLVQELTLNKDRNPAGLERRLVSITTSLREMGQLQAAKQQRQAGQAAPKDDKAAEKSEQAIDAKAASKAKTVVGGGSSSSRSSGRPDCSKKKSASVCSGSTEGGGGRSAPRCEAKGVFRPVLVEGDDAGRSSPPFTSDEDEVSCATDATHDTRPVHLEHRRCILTCCAPEGSPLIGESFVLGAEGGDIGRKPSCKVSLCRRVDTNGDGTFAGVATLDSAISAEHATIKMDPRTGKFYISDGNQQKGSTNGTWYRLSGPGHESRMHRLEAKHELLIGTLRFQVSEGTTISERIVFDDVAQGADVDGDIKDNNSTNDEGSREDGEGMDQP